MSSQKVILFFSYLLFQVKNLSLCLKFLPLVNMCAFIFLRKQNQMPGLARKFFFYKSLYKMTKIRHILSTYSRKLHFLNWYNICICKNIVKTHSISVLSILCREQKTLPLVTQVKRKDKRNLIKQGRFWGLLNALLFHLICYFFPCNFTTFAF